MFTSFSRTGLSHQCIFAEKQNYAHSFMPLFPPDKISRAPKQKLDHVVCTIRKSHLCSVLVDFIFNPCSEPPFWLVKSGGIAVATILSRPCVSQASCLLSESYQVRINIT